MHFLKELKLNIACSIYWMPCAEEELFERDFLKFINKEGVQRIIMDLEKDALYYKGDVMHIKKDWAKKNLREYGD